MTAAKPPARQRAVGALASGFATAELHHHRGHDPCDIGGLMCMPLRRIQFRRAEALRDLARRTTAKFASVVIGMGVDRERFHSAFAPLGRIAAL